MAELETDNLAHWIERKHSCLVALRDLGRRQRELAEADDLSQLFKLLSTKQQLINLLHDIGRELEPYRAQHPDQRRWRAPADRARAAQLSNDCAPLLQEILEQEQQCEARLRERRDETATQLQHAKTAVVARQAYIAPDRQLPGMLDLTSD